VKEIEPSEISLLFKSLVVLPEDKAAKPSPKNSETKVNPVLNVPKTTELGTPSATQPPTIAKAEAPEGTNVTEKPKVTFTKKRITILTTPELKEAYLKTGSNFLKTLDALKAPQLSEHLNTDHTLLERAHQYMCIWCIGLDIKSEKEAKQTAHENLLCSPDLNSLKTTEEKKAMYIPLKNFVALNSELVSSL
jgi:hypothetical protein